MKIEFENRLVLSAMAGINNAEFCLRHPVGLAILGGFNADNKSNEVGKKVEGRGRKEFIFEEPVEGIEKEVRIMRKNRRNFAVNVRSATIDGYLAAAEVVKKHGGIIEINAHCRQPEFIEIKCGQWLIFHPDRLVSIVSEVSEIDIPISVKLRGGLNVDYPEIVRKVKKAGCSIIHMDAMIEGGGCDLNLLSKLSGNGFLIGNNSVVDIGSAERIIKTGANMVSVARSVLKDEKFFVKLLESKLLRERVELEGTTKITRNVRDMN